MQTPKESESPEGVALDPSNIDSVSAKLADLKTSAELTSPFDDDSDDEEDEVDLTDYTEEEIGCVPLPPRTQLLRAQADELPRPSCQNKSVRILPGVRRLIDSLPKERFAVATSGAKTCSSRLLPSPSLPDPPPPQDCHGALLRAGIQRPKITITADDPRLKRGKPFPDPFLLAASELGFPIEKCLVFEDSPSGIKAGVVSGAVTIAVCTSHPGASFFRWWEDGARADEVPVFVRAVEKIANCGAHYIVPSLDCVHAFPNKDGTIRIGSSTRLALENPQLKLCSQSSTRTLPSTRSTAPRVSTAPFLLRSRSSFLVSSHHNDTKSTRFVQSPQPFVDA